MGKKREKTKTVDAENSDEVNIVAESSSETSKNIDKLICQLAEGMAHLQSQMTQLAESVSKTCRDSASQEISKDNSKVSKVIVPDRHYVTL